MRGKNQRDWVKTRVHEYEITLTKIIPRDIEVGSDVLTEEIYHLLTNRDSLEADFAISKVKVDRAMLWERVKELDQALLVQRDDIVEALGRDNYRRYRERLHKTPQEWWWYLDEPSRAELPDWIMAETLNPES